MKTGQTKRVWTPEQKAEIVYRHLNTDNSINVEYDFPPASSNHGKMAVELFLRTMKVIDDTYPELSGCIGKKSVKHTDGNGGSGREVSAELSREFMSVYMQTRSVPLGDEESAWNWMIGKMRFFREQGLDPEKMKLLANNVMMYMTSFYCARFEEFLSVADIDMVVSLVRELQQNGDRQKAKEIAIPCWEYISNSDEKQRLSKEQILILAIAAKG